MAIGNYEYIYAGSGGRILSGTSFTSSPRTIGDAARNAGWAAMSAVAKFLSEEMSGEDSQFYSLRTGGHYRIFYGSPTGIDQLHYCINHWQVGPVGEPFVTAISLPFINDGHECFVHARVLDSWQMHIENAIALAPLMQPPRQERSINLTLEDVLMANLASCTFHFCWKENSHQAFISGTQEPQFEIVASGVRKLPHRSATMEMVKNLLSD